MKKKILYILPVFVLSITSCSSSTQEVLTTSSVITSSSISINSSTSDEVSIEEKRFDKVHKIDKLKSYSFNLFQGEREIKVKPNPNGEIKVNNPTYFYGNVNSLKITPNKGYRLSLILRNGIFYSQDYPYFYTNSSDTYEALFIKEDKKAVTFLDESYRLIEQLELDIDYSLPSYPYEEREGYDLVIDSKVNSKTKDVVVIPTYFKKTTPEVELVNLSINELDYTSSSLVSFTPSSSNLFFEAYYKDDELVSLDKNYKTKLRHDLKMEATFTTSPLSSTPLISLDKKYIKKGGEILVRGEYNALENNTLVEIGIAYKEKKDDLLDNVKLINLVNTDEEDNSFIASLDYKKGYYQGYLTYRLVKENEISYITYLSNICEIV